MIVKLVFADLLRLAPHLRVQIYKLGFHHGFNWFVLRLLVKITCDNHWAVLEIRLEVLTNFEALANALILELFLGLEMRLSKDKLLRSVLNGTSAHRLLLIATLLIDEGVCSCFRRQSAVHVKL